MKQTPLAQLAMRAVGWTFAGTRPTVKKYVCTAVPHTSNWDGALMILVAGSIGMPMRFMIKDEWVRGPLGPLMRNFGAIPIDRSGKHNVVAQMVAEFERSDELALIIPPEGTRSRSENWRSGFYHIARGANVPVVPGYLDFKRKRAGLGPPIDMTGDVRADMDKLRTFYRSIDAVGHDPSAVGPMRLKEEG